MRFLWKLIVSLLLNSAALFAAGRFVHGFTVTRDPKEFLFAAALLTLANLIARPLLKLIFSPVILLTLGLFSFVINAGLLWIIDFYSPGITIQGLPALLWGTVIVSIASILAHALARHRAD